MRVTNYARHRVTKEYVFFGPADVPPDALIDTQWAWFQPPRHPRADEVLLVGESSRNRFDRLGRH